MTATIRFGTMGWAYDDWRGPFYSRDLRSDRMLEQYARIFDTVELDTTFYGAPRLSTLTGWAASVSAGFCFSAKVPRAVTHERRLVTASEAALDFGGLLRKGLGNRLGALLLQLPPDFTAEDRPTLDTFIREITTARREPDLPWVVEFRHTSWQETTIAADLAAQGVLTATTERLDTESPLRYVRLLGTENSVARFDARQFPKPEELAVWAKRLQDADGTVFVYVRNFYEGHAPATVLALRSLLGLPEIIPPGAQQMSLF